MPNPKTDVPASPAQEATPPRCECAIAQAMRAWFDRQVQVSGREHVMPWLPMDVLTALVEDFDARAATQGG